MLECKLLRKELINDAHSIIFKIYEISKAIFYKEYVLLKVKEKGILWHPKLNTQVLGQKKKRKESEQNKKKITFQRKA